MKSVFVIFLLMLCSFSRAQQIIVEEHTVHWVGGQCCASGVNYNFLVKIPKGQWQQFDSLQVCTPSGSFGMNKNKLTCYYVGDTLMFNITHRHRSENAKADILPVNRVNVEGCQTTILSLFSAYVRRQVNSTSHTSQHVALP